MSAIHSILCHVVGKDGQLQKVTCLIDQPQVSCAALLKHEALEPFISPKHQIFRHPNQPLEPQHLLSDAAEVFVLGPCRITPQQWRQQRLTISAKTE